MNKKGLLLCAVLMGAAACLCQAESVSFVPRELFRISFGTGKEKLGARVDGGNFIFPRDFTMDAAGHFYIYDSNNHRIVRYSPEGRYEMEFRYLPTAAQVFAHADSHENLWLLISDPAEGLFYGVYNPGGHQIKSGIFSKFTHFRLHVDDDAILHVILSSTKDPAVEQTYIFDEEKLLMKKENVAPPPETHHQIRKSDKVYFVDQVPNGAQDDPHRVNHITDASHHSVADIKGNVAYVTGLGDIYARDGERRIDIYDVSGSLKGKVVLSGLASAARSVRFDSVGNIYELDGIPDKDGQYSAEMPGMRLLLWERR